MANFAEEHDNKVTVLNLDQNIGNWTKVALTFESDLAIVIIICILDKGLREYNEKKDLENYARDLKLERYLERFA